MLETIKPCPFCGGEAEIKSNENYLETCMYGPSILDSILFYGICTQCKSRGPKVKSKKSAVDSWNTRQDSLENKNQLKLKNGWVKITETEYINLEKAMIIALKIGEDGINRSIIHPLNSSNMGYQFQTGFIDPDPHRAIERIINSGEDANL